MWWRDGICDDRLHAVMMIIAKDGSLLVLWTCKAFKSFICCFKLRLRLHRCQEQNFTTKPSELTVNNAGLLEKGGHRALFWTFNSTQLWFFKTSSFKNSWKVTVVQKHKVMFCGFIQGISTMCISNLLRKTLWCH